VDPKGAVWVTNFGFQTADCTNTATDLFVSVSKFNADGEALSPDGDPASNIAGGYLGDGNIGAPQGVLSDRGGNVWLANCYTDSVTRFRHGSPNKAKNFFNGLERVTGVQIDPSGNVWEVNNWLINGFTVENPGGRQVVVFLGLAAPVKAPLLGTPQRP
jgi:hypothetical protein